MNDRMAIDVVDGSHEAVLEFLLRCDTDVAEHRAGELGEEAFDEIEPRAVRRREDELEAADALLGEPVARLFRDVRRMIVEDQLDCGVRRVSRVQQLEEFDELTAAMAILDQGMHLAGEQVDPGEQADGAVTLVFVIALESLMSAGLRSYGAGGEGVASSSPSKLMEMPHDNSCKRYESIPRRL